MANVKYEMRNGNPEMTKVFDVKADSGKCTMGSFMKPDTKVQVVERIIQYKEYMKAERARMQFRGKGWEVVRDRVMYKEIEMLEDGRAVKHKVFFLVLKKLIVAKEIADRQQIK